LPIIPNYGEGYRPISRHYNNNLVSRVRFYAQDFGSFGHARTSVARVNVYHAGNWIRDIGIVYDPYNPANVANQNRIAVANNWATHHFPGISIPPHYNFSQVMSAVRNAANASARALAAGFGVSVSGDATWDNVIYYVGRAAFYGVDRQDGWSDSYLAYRRNSARQASQAAVRAVSVERYNDVRNYGEQARQGNIVAPSGIAAFSAAPLNLQLVWCYPKSESCWRNSVFGAKQWNDLDVG
jgi:hypothetical protein